MVNLYAIRFLQLTCDINQYLLIRFVMSISPTCSCANYAPFTKFIETNSVFKIYQLSIRQIRDSIFSWCGNFCWSDCLVFLWVSESNDKIYWSVFYRFMCLEKNRTLPEFQWPLLQVISKRSPALNWDISLFKYSF